MEGMFDALLDALWVPATYAKLAFLAVTSPVWLPLAKIMYREMKPALNAPEEQIKRRLPPGEDPFLNIPLATYRARRDRSAARTIRRR